MSLSVKKSNILSQLEQAFIVALFSLQEAKKGTQSNSLGHIKNALHNARECSEAMSKYLILDKISNGLDILSGNDNGFISGDSRQRKGRGREIDLHTIIEVLFQKCIFDGIATSSNLEKGENGTLRTDFHRLRFKGNKGSHITLNEEENPTLTDCEKLIKLVLEDRIKWFYVAIGMEIPDKIQNAFNREIQRNELPKLSEWYLLKNQFEDFNDTTAQYVLVVNSEFRKNTSENEMSAFAESSVNWNLVIDFDYESQQKGLEKAFKKTLGKEGMRTITKGDEIPDINSLYYFLAQGKFIAEVEKNPTKWEKDRNGYGKTLEQVLIKLKPRRKVFLMIINNDISFINKTMSIIYGTYFSIAKDITIGIVINNKKDEIIIQEMINKEFPDIFGDIYYHLFDFSELINYGFSLKKKNIDISNNEYIIPAFSKDRKHVTISLNSDIYKDLQIRYIELVHKYIARENLPKETNFYLGDEITWQDLNYLGKGRDIERNKVTQTILPELLGLLQNKPKGVWIYKLNHEASAGGTTTAKRIAYEIGTKLPNSYPTILIHKYLPTETAKCIANLYEKTHDKPIFAVIEEFEMGEKLLNKLESEIRDLQKTLVVLYVSRNRSSVEERDKIRKLPTQLETVEIEYFEELFIELKPDKEKAIRTIRKEDSKFQIPFMYGLTAFGKDFKKIDSYVDNVLDSVINSKVLKFLGYVALIGRYTQNTVPEELFYNYIGVPDKLELKEILLAEEIDNIEKLYSFHYEIEGNIKVPCVKIRNLLFAEDISEKLLTSRNVGNRHFWKINLKNWFIDFISITKDAYADGELYPLDKKIIDALFIDKENYIDEQEKTTFSRLITAINKEIGYKESREILIKLAETFNENPEDAFYSQHLARLFYFSAKNEQGLTIEEKKTFFDEAIEYADNAINLYIQFPESDKSTSGLYHTKGHAAMLKIEFINSNFKTYTREITPDIVEEEVKKLYEISAEALEKCLVLDENSTYGYLSYSYLIVQVLNFGRIKSGYSDFISFFEDEEYEWYLDKRDLGIEIITKASEFWRKFNANRREDISFDIESSKSITSKLKFEEKIEQNLASLLIFNKNRGTRLKKRDYELKIRNAKSQRLKSLWQNAYIEFILGEKDFSNYYTGITRLNSEELNDIIQLLRTSLEYKPTLRDFKRWMRGVRSDMYNIDIQTSINFIEYLYNILPENILLFRLEVEYYLFCLLTIQVINEGSSVETIKIAKINQYQRFCKDIARRLSLRRTSSFEWLGKNKKDGLEQLVSRDKLGDISAVREFFKDTSVLREVYGTIKSVGSGSEGTERKIGEIELDHNPELKAFFIPIHGGYIMEKNVEKKCRFDNTNNINTRVKFYIGFSYDGLRAYQPIPEDAVRVDNKTTKKKDQVIVTGTSIIENSLAFKVTDIRRQQNELMGIVNDEKSFIFIPFENGKTYDDYKYFRGQVIPVTKTQDGYKIL